MPGLPHIWRCGSKIRHPEGKQEQVEATFSSWTLASEVLQHAFHSVYWLRHLWGTLRFREKDHRLSPWWRCISVTLLKNKNKNNPKKKIARVGEYTGVAFLAKERFLQETIVRKWKAFHHWCPLAPAFPEWVPWMNCPFYVLSPYSLPLRRLKARPPSMIYTYKGPSLPNKHSQRKALIKVFSV